MMLSVVTNYILASSVFGHFLSYIQVKKKNIGQDFAKHAIIPCLVQLNAIIVMYVSVVCKFYLTYLESD